MITCNEVRERVEQIRADDDNETRHMAEDAIYRDVLRAIADGAYDAGGLAREALEAAAIEYDRWYA